MSTYKFKTRVRINRGKVTSEMVEDITFTRAEVEKYLVKLNHRIELNNGEKILKKILGEALANPNWKKITISKKS